MHSITPECQLERVLLVYLGRAGERASSPLPLPRAFRDCVLLLSLAPCSRALTQPLMLGQAQKCGETGRKRCLWIDFELLNVSPHATLPGHEKPTSQV